MVIEKKRHLLALLTNISDSQEIRDYEASFLRKYVKAMTNRQNFFVNRQKAQQGEHISSVYDLLRQSKN